MLERSRIVARDIAAARRFYAATARSLGLKIIPQDDGFAVGEAIRVHAIDKFDETPETQPAYVAIEVPDALSVRSFYRAALAAGGREAEHPQARMSGPVARVIDPDGNCIECSVRH